MQSSGSWDGGLTPNEFCVAAIELSDRWKQIDTGLPQWEWIPRVSCLSIQNEGYLSMEGVYRCNSSEVLKPCIESLYSSVEGHVTVQGILEEEEPIDIATLILSDVGENRVYDFHIVYSFSYRVPVLYFRGYQSGGQPLNLDEIQKDLPCYSLTILRDSKWTFMTQEVFDVYVLSNLGLMAATISEGLFLRYLITSVRPVQQYYTGLAILESELGYV